MSDSIHNFKLQINFKLLGFLSSIDRFTGEWSSIERREGSKVLEQLKSSATVNNVAASTRIAGGNLTNDEVRALIFNSTKIEHPLEHDQQVALGYFEVLTMITESYRDIDISESSLKELQGQLLKYSAGPNNVMTRSAETEEALRDLLQWYSSDVVAPPLLKTAVFVYEFLRIQPFQIGNGRLSRLLSTLLVLKSGYPWLQYTGFEQELESRKAEYEGLLSHCRRGKHDEHITPWLEFFFECLSKAQSALKKKLELEKSENQLAPRDRMIYTFIESHPGSKSGEISEKLNIPLPTVKKMLAKMLEAKLIVRFGNGAGSNYSTEKLRSIKSDIAFRFTAQHYLTSFMLANRYAYVSIKKILLVPNFEWRTPEDWNKELLKQNLELSIKCISGKGTIRKQRHSLLAFSTAAHSQPNFTLKQPIHLPLSLYEKEPFDNEFPIKVNVELCSDEVDLKFDVIVLYDAVLE